MAGRFKSSCEVAIVGYARSQTYRHAPVPLGVLTMDTCLKAIADAGLKKEQIDGFTTGAQSFAAGGHEMVDGVDVVSSLWLAEQMGAHTRWLSGFQGAGQLPGAVMLAVNAIASGAADYVLLHRSLGNPPGRYHENAMTEAAGEAQWTAPQGYWSPVAAAAMYYREYMQRYGATREDMARTVVEIRRLAAQLPWAYWHNKPITVDDYMQSRMIVEPISLLDCDIPIDVAAAFVFTSAERARDLPHKPVYVAGFAGGTMTVPDTPYSLDHAEAGGDDTGRRFWEQIGLTPKDIDLPQIYDGFSPMVYSWLESLGYCKRGEGPHFLRDQPDLTRFFSGGGSLGNGRAHGIPPMLECYLQLSGRAAERQLPDMRTGFACHSHPHDGAVVAYCNERY